MVVELDRDPNVYPDGNIVEVCYTSFLFARLHELWFQWPRVASQPLPQLDGFTIRRTGDVETKIRVIMYLEHSPEQFKIKDPLGFYFSRPSIQPDHVSNRAYFGSKRRQSDGRHTSTMELHKNTRFTR
jgi:hypothetical protein